jgi:phage shock protein A
MAERQIDVGGGFNSMRTWAQGVLRRIGNLEATAVRHEGELDDAADWAERMASAMEEWQGALDERGRDIDEISQQANAQLHSLFARVEYLEAMREEERKRPQYVATSGLPLATEYQLGELNTHLTATVAALQRQVDEIRTRLIRAQTAREEIKVELATLKAAVSPVPTVNITLSAEERTNYFLEQERRQRRGR